MRSRVNLHRNRRSKLKGQLTVERLERRDMPSFFTAPTFSAGGDANVVVAEDFNGDGVRDLAVGNQSTVSIMLAGPGGYQAPSPNAAGSSIRDVIAADLTGDGILDLAVANFTASSNLRVLKGNGDGTFQPAVAYSAGNLLRAVVAGDFDADGDLDLAAASFWSRNLAILNNAGDGDLYHDYGGRRYLSSRPNGRRF